MRISIRRCLSMLRNTVYGNELTMPIQCLSKVYSVEYWYTVWVKIEGKAWYYIGTRPGDWTIPDRCAHWSGTVPSSS